MTIRPESKLGVPRLTIEERGLLNKLIAGGLINRTARLEAILKNGNTRHSVTNGQSHDEARNGRVEAVHRIHVVLPAYNEEASLPKLLARFGQLPNRQSLTIWVVDDGSKDKTAEAARRGTPGADIRLVSHSKNLGLGAAVQTGIRAALEIASEKDVIAVMDADDTHDTNLLAEMTKQVEGGADIVLASRFVPGGCDATAPPFRRLLSRGAAWVFKYLFPVANVQDFTSGFRMYRVTLLARSVEHWGERLIEERGFACMVELLLKLRYCRPVIAEVPLVLRYDRKAGESKLKLFRTLIQYLKLGLRDRLQPPPIRDL